ncbi:hypothetical protein BDV95DRAFT_600613 [Massariosphaeria phaeospora]|uniref:Uncharacterized protein n=1 Tax=Massariosphaeria phaeospora TaxID=100035 RepID=A0A7C8MHW4_9PLEO|nr:hypothetical protein BDV95DRAFT_600613 [Massariosphaeria phaeospora]
MEADFGRRAEENIFKTPMIQMVDCPSYYGCLIDFPDVESAQVYETDGCGLDIPQGIRVLDIQQGLYSFLATCCQKLLHDIPKPWGAEFPIQLASPIKVGQQYIHKMFADAAKTTPYHARSSLDVTRLRDLISELCGSAKDHMWALREDPEYFAEFVLAQKEHT